MKIDNNEIQNSIKVSNFDFPNWSDYYQYFITQGIISSEEDAIMDENLIKAIHKHWHGLGQNGCIFALLAAREDNPNWSQAVFSPDFNDEKSIERFLSKVDAEIGKAISNPECEIISLLFPSIKGYDEVAKLIHAFTQSKYLFIEDISLQKNDLYTIAVRVEVSVGVLSWVMAFSDIESLPLTRRSPITELAIRVKPKPTKQFHRLTPSENEAHLADLTIPYNEKVTEKIWDNTFKRTRMILGGEPDLFSAAKTTITIPKDYIGDLTNF